MYKIKLDGKILYYPGDREAAVINPELDLQTGYAGELTLKVPALNPLYNDIHNRKSMISVYRDKTEIFYGEVRTREKDRFKNQPIKATGALSFLADTILPQQEWHDMSPREMLDAWLQLHNNQVEDRKKIYIGVVTIHDSNDSLYRITDRENTLEAIREKLVDRLGGYLRLRHEDDKLYLDWIKIQEYGKYCEQPIQFGENLLDYSETMTADDVITALIPLGAAIEEDLDENASEFERLEKNVDITSVNDGKDYIYSKEAVESFGWVWATEKWDDVGTPANLLKKATEYLTTQQYENLVISLTTVDLSLFGQDYDSFDIGDRVLCNAIPYGMKKVLPVMEMKIPLQQPDQAQLTLGENLQQSFTDQTTGTFTQIRQETTEAGRVQTSWMKSAIDNLTKQMTGAKGGYKLTEFDENGLWLRDLYMDAPDKDQATNILQINKNGIGGSHNGYNGPYTIGMTLDGTIIGERILAGSIKTEALSTECKNYIETKISDGDSANKTAILKEVTTSLEAMDGKITLSVSSLEQQLERKSGNWYGNYEPTSENNPASAWTTDELRQEHERDLFFNTTTGYAYQYQKNDSNEYGWVRVKDKDIEAAQSTAESALSKIEVQEGLITAEVSRAKGEEEKLRSAITMTETSILSTVSKTYTTQEMANKLYADAVQEGQTAADNAEKNAKDDTDTKLKNYSTTVEMNSAISQAADSITLEVSKTYATTGQLEEKYMDAVKTGQTAADTAKSTAETAISRITVAENSITSEVSRAKGAESTLSSRITQTETEIESKVSAGEIASSINQTAQSVKINASKIDFNGIVTANSYFKILTDGSMECISGKIGGFWIDSTSLYAYATGNYKMEINSSEKKMRISDGSVYHISHKGTNRNTVVIGGATTTALFGDIDCGDGAFDSIKTQSITATTASSFNAISSSSTITARGKIKSSSHIEASGHFYNTGSGNDLSDLSVRGTKKRIFDTKDYGTQAFYCYEMASPIFGDVGKATISDDGTCLIDLDDIFQESVNAEIIYYVFLQKESDGDCWVEEKEPTHFVVKGTPGLKFSFEIKAMQTNYEHMRFADASETAYDRAVEELDFDYAAQEIEISEPDYETELENDRVTIINQMEAAA